MKKGRYWFEPDRLTARDWWLLADIVVGFALIVGTVAGLTRLLLPLVT